MASKNNKGNKNSSMIPEKRVKPKKETVMMIKSKYDPTVETRAVIGEKYWFGKDYVILQNY